MGTKVGFVYGEQSKILRRIIVPTNDAELPGGHVGPGEAMIIADKADGFTVAIAEAAIELITGTPAPNSRVAVIDNGNDVVAVIRADLNLDTPPPGMRFVPSQVANKGWKHTPGQGFLPPQAKPPHPTNGNGGGGK